MSQVCKCTFFHFVRYCYPVRSWETCPRGKGGCSIAKLDNVFRFGADLGARLARTLCDACGSATKGGLTKLPGVEVSLDGVETKSEDC